MRLDAELRYPAEPSAVLAMLTDPAFQERKCRDGHALSHQVSVTPGPDGVTVVVRQEQGTDTFPSFVKSFVGATLTVVETSVWQPVGADGTAQAAITVEIAGAPVVLRARARLQPVDGGSLQRVEGDLKASVPFVGGKIEQAAEPAIRAAIALEERTGQAWLAGR
ncbi:MAG: DUF2505 domain-containing protein [Kineosporiaceae bacterium]